MMANEPNGNNAQPTGPSAPGPTTTNGTAPPPSKTNQEDQKLRGISRSLLIAVGGTGHKILLDVRQRLLQKYGTLDKLPIISFLLLDTDQAIFQKNPNYSDAANLDNADKIHTSVYGVENLRRNLREYPHLRDWLDPRTLSGDIAQGAGAVRARGRLAYFWNYDQISKRIQEEAIEITKDASKAAAIRNGLQVSESVTVYIVGSLLGGTGSGMFLDLAYTVKQALKSQQNLETVGIFAIPPNTQAVAVDNRPNAYAGLLELNHYTDSSTTFTAQYKADAPPLENADPPFRYTYLADTSSPAANLGSVDKLVEMLGHSIFLDMTSEFQRQKRSNRDNFDQFLTNPDDLGCPQNYLAMGLAAIHFPKDKVLTACASRLARQIITRWTEPLQRVANIGAFTEAELDQLGLDPNQVQRQLTIANAESGDLLRDAAQGFWKNANNQYETAYPGHGKVVDLLAAKQAEQSVRFVDTDPNPDLLAKRRENLGADIFQIQQNLKFLIPAKESALREFISECVNDPNRRHGVARAFLDQAGERFRAFADGLGKERDNQKETLVPLAEQRDANLGSITGYARDPLLSVIMGAKKREIDEKKDVYLKFARQWDTAFLDIRAADAAIYFYTAMASVLEKLKGEMDAYIERMKGLEAFFRKEEQTAIENPVDVNGAILFDRGRRVELENGTATYVDGDIDNRYAAYVGDGSDPGNPAVSTASTEALAELGTTGNIYGLREADRSRIISVLTDRARRVFAAVEAESVLDKFFEKYGMNTDRSIEELRRVYGLSQPFIHLQENAPNYKHHQNKQQTIVGMMHGAEGRTDAEARFLTMLRDTVQGIRDGQISNANEPHQVLFLRERAAFPLRLLEGMDSYRFAYEQAKAQGASANPIHTRKDVKEWVRISPPSFEDQKRAWQTFCVAWASGVITEKHEMRYTSVGRRDAMTFEAAYRDQFGLPKTDPLGGFGRVDGDLAQLVRDAQDVQTQEARPPLEGREMVLLLCDHHSIREHIERGVEGKLNEIGANALGDMLVAHANAQEKLLPTPIYRPYAKAIRDYLEEINYSGGRDNGTQNGYGNGYGAPSAMPVAVAAPEAVAAVSGPTIAEPTPALPAPAAQSAGQTVRERLANLKSLFDDGLITQEDFNARKTTILGDV